jgi:serine/threonine protein phosphatase PrpC
VAQFRNAVGAGVGPWRVWFTTLDYPGLAMSRAFGDTPCKRIGVTADPELSVTPLTAGDEILVVASDGVWEYLSNEEAVALAASAPTAAAGAAALVEAAEAAWRRHQPGYVDDITALVVRLK